ncbi:glycosyl hydrolase family 28-related protein [Pontiella sulfatireligans]|uniref:Rhamnogalacturonase A/B/Epimerase-like pectate lyase domain-containing protein n=1 Tax=Pontiella sulfatireligans TaxID=2750658 RepID=A0A6C2UFG8_9BACT|nr:glycosyl hydrolase family 28-related protein [Pontiella sulfatireligans]VGO18962.1 hypothetical protein SCARR_01016 [Pontiella sulfatireligans]
MQIKPLVKPMLLPMAFFILSFQITFAAQAKRPEPGTPRINETQFETQDYVIATHDVRDYGVIANDKDDDTQSFQKAIDACEQDGGGVIFVPAGYYVFRDRLILKSGVHLRGEWSSPDVENLPRTSTLFAIYYGRGEPDAEPFITLGESCGLKDLALWYPEQNFAEPVPYAWTIQQRSGLSAGLENITVYNSWNGIQAGPSHNQLLTIKNLFMTTLHTGFLRDEIYDCQKLQKIYMRPKYWMESNLPGSPKTPAEQVALKKHLLKESTGAVITHYDWTWMYDWVIEGFHTGIEVSRSKIKTEDRGPNGGFVNLKLIDNFIGMQVGDVNRCGWADTDVYIRSRLKNAIGIKVTAPLKSVAQFLNITFEGSFKYCVLSEASLGVVSMSGCSFNGWADDGYAVYAESGVIQLIQNDFSQSGNHIYLGNGIKSAAVLGNRFKGVPDIGNNTTKRAEVIIDHTGLDLKQCDLSRFEYPDAIYKPEKADLFNVRDFGAKGDAVTDDSTAFVKALNAAEKNGGGTVYIPVGKYVLKKELIIPSNIEVRGVFENCHHTKNGNSWRKQSNKKVYSGQRGSELFAFPGKGDEQGAPFIRLNAGASLRGLTIYYPEQKWSDYEKSKAFTPYPWTVQSLGPNVRMKDVLLVNSYKGADFGTYDSTGHNIDYLCGAVLKTGLYIDNCFGKGFVKNVQWNPSFWGWSGYPDSPGGSRELRDVVRYTLTGFVFGYSEQENMLQNFSFGTKTGIHFIGNPEHGGINGTLIAHGIDHSGVSMVFDDVGDDAQFVNFQIVSMEMDARRRYLDIRDGVKGKAQFYSLLGWGHNPCAETGIEMHSGDFYFLFSSFASFGLDYGIKQTGGTLKAVGMRFGEPIRSPIAGGYESGLYGYFGEGIDGAEIIGAIKKKNPSDGEAFINKAGSKVKIMHSIPHDGF